MLGHKQCDIFGTGIRTLSATHYAAAVFTGLVLLE
jgi:hypothetical protein